MAIYDRWYTTERANGSSKKVRSADYGCEKRWQARWRDDQGRQRKQAFERKTDAERFEATVKTQLASGTYVDPSAGDVTLQVYAEGWRGRQTHDTASAERIAGAFRRHVYSAPGTPGRTPTGAPSIGDYPLRALARQPSIVQGWLAGIKLHPNTVRMVVAMLRPVFTAAVEDGLIAKNPLAAKQLRQPKAVKTDVAAWSAEQVAAVADALPARWSALSLLGAAVGMRQGELFALAVDDVRLPPPERARFRADQAGRRPGVLRADEEPEDQGCAGVRPRDPAPGRARPPAPARRGHVAVA